MMSWQNTMVQIQVKMDAIDAEMLEICGCPQKARTKKKNYALIKVKEPPSDNE